MVLGVRGEGVAAGVDPYAGPSRYIVVEPDVGRFGLIELHVPVAVRRDFFGKPLP